MTTHQQEFMKWSVPKLNAHAQFTLTGYDNGDGDGPHYFNLELDTQSAGDFGSTTNISIQSIEELKNLANSFMSAYHRALF